MKQLRVAAILILLFLAPQKLQAHSKPIGDIILKGAVERDGRKIPTDTTIFEGDSIRTLAGSGGVVRVAGGRVEIGESSEVSFDRRDPLRIVVKSGSMDFSFPAGATVEIVTPQLQVRPDPGQGQVSGRVSAETEAQNRIESRRGNYTVLETLPNGDTNRIGAGEVLIASLMPAVPVAAASPVARPQGPIGGARIAVVQTVEGDVRVARAATPNTLARITAPGLGLASGDWIRTLQGRARVLFNDQSEIELDVGTSVQIAEQPAAGGVSRRINQFLGRMWFNIQRITGSETTLTTPTAVAAIRGTQGLQEVPNDTQSTHSLDEGSELVTEILTQQSVTIGPGQRITAIRGFGFTPIVALLAALPRPGFGGGGAGGAGAGAGTSAATTTAAASTVSSVASVAAVSVTAATTTVASIVPLVAEPRRTASPSTP